MVGETTAFGGAIVVLVIGMAVMIQGVLVGGVNPVLGAGSAPMVASVGWLAPSLETMEGGPEESGH